MTRSNTTTIAIRRIQTEYDRLQNRIDAMYIDKLDGRTGTNFFDRRIPITF